ncbi:uncharacterized protein A4U43_C08F2920 [Asparagus officinalis]|nr:uncharacterized protein A4U43_C08F2920 [Asparagus officinalis]
MQVREEIKRIIETYGGSRNRPLSLTITGHSLGAALAVLAAYDITATVKNHPMVTVVSFGGPRVGNSSFRRKLEEQGSKVLRIVNTQDIITKVPGFVVDQEIEQSENEINIPSWILRKTGWVYADIGQELRVSGERTANVVACHDLNVYLSLVNQLSTTCPLRARVKESFRWPFSVQLTSNGR